MFVADFFFGWGKMMSNGMITWYTYDLNFKYIFRFFCSLRFFSPIKKLHDPHLLVLPWGEFGGHWPKGLVLIQSQMVPSNETWTALVDCLGKASCWQRALDHTLEGTFMAGTCLGGYMSWVWGWGWVRVGKVDLVVDVVGRCVWLVIGGGCVVFFFKNVRCLKYLYKSIPAVSQCPKWKIQEIGGLGSDLEWI